MRGQLCRAVVGLGALAAVLSGCTEEAPVPILASDMRPGHATGAALPEPDGTLLAGRYVVVFQPRVGDPGAAAEEITRQFGGTLGHVYRDALRGFSAQLPAAAVEALRGDPRVRYVEPDVWFTIDASQSLGGDASMWGLDRVDYPNDGSYPYLDDTYTSYFTGAGVHVYIIDTGIETADPEFTGRLGTSHAVAASTYEDCHGHGTGVASAAAGSTYGTAKQATIHAVRTTADCGTTAPKSDIIAAIDWVTKYHEKPAVANFSAGCYPTLTTTECGSSIDDAVNGAIASGVNFVASAGNDNRDACEQTPARVPDAITVGATNRYDERWSGSNWGSCLDLFAPGVEVRVAWKGAWWPSETGTSFAAPYVTGVVALILQQDPNWTVTRPVNVLTESAFVLTPTTLGSSSPARLLNSRHTYVNISGPTGVTVGGTYTWYAKPLGGDGSYSYVWDYSADGVTWHPVSSEKTYTRTITDSDSSFHLRVQIRSAGATANAELDVLCLKCGETL